MRSAIRHTVLLPTSSGCAVHAAGTNRLLPWSVASALVEIERIDRAWYVAEAQALVDRVLGTNQGAKQLSLLDGN